MDIEKNVLIIDDDKDLVNTIRIVLESKNYKIRVAYDGKEGYQKIAEMKPDLIILDVMMTTDTEGFDLAYKLKNDEEFKKIPILMLTSFVQKMAEKGPERFQHIMGEAWPVAHFMEKPIEPDALLKVVADLLKDVADV